MWLPIHLHGLAPFRATLKEKLLLTGLFYNKIQSLGFETGPSPDLTITIFRYADDNDNSINEKLINALHKDGRVFFSSTIIHGRLWIRCAIVHFRTHLEEVKLALEMIEEIIEKIKIPSLK